MVWSQLSNSAPPTDYACVPPPQQPRPHEHPSYEHPSFMQTAPAYDPPHLLRPPACGSRTQHGEHGEHGNQQPYSLGLSTEPHALPGAQQQQMLHQLPIEALTPSTDGDDDGESGVGLFTHGDPESGRCFRRVGDIPEGVLGSAMALILEDFCRSPQAGVGQVFPRASEPAAIFYSPYRQKGFSLEFYCRRLLEYTHCSKSCVVAAMLYVVRLSQRYAVFRLNDFNVHRVFCTALRLAIKFVDDNSFSNAHYAKVAGIQSAVEMNRLEALMLKCLDYRLFVPLATYHELDAQIAHIAGDCT